MHSILACAVVCFSLPLVASFPMFRSKIPNGFKVEYPSCRPNSVWNGVGHYREAGGGPRNQFGLDFLSNGTEWTTALCQGDSDGDGMTNGYELGDPNCVWTENATPARIIDITHPGICNPWESSDCASFNADFELSCDKTELNCTEFDESTLNVTVRFPPTPVPDKHTTYECMAFNFPQDQAYHLIGYEPVIDNENVMHHITLFGCMSTVPADEIGVVRECGESMDSCNFILGIWSLGLNGHCVHENAGFQIGLNGGFMQGVIQHHWNNPLLATNYMDGSGMKLYYTSVLRPYNAGLFIFGQNYLEIPPTQPMHTEEGECPALCTNQYFTGDVQVYAAFNHMHYLGTEMRTTLYRNDIEEAIIAEDSLYFYDSPKLHEHQTPITMKPGDSIITTCGYQSMSRNETTIYGQATHDEMCFSLVYYYPTSNMAQNAFTCIAWKGIPECERRSGVVDGCSLNEFHGYWNSDKEARRIDILNSCGNFDECTAECFNVTMWYRHDPCLYGDVYDLIKDEYLDDYYERLEFHIALETCGLCFRYYNLSDPENEFKKSYDLVLDKCKPLGKCLPKCQKAFDSIQNHPCMRHDVYTHFRQYALREKNIDWLIFHYAKRSCDP